MPREPSDSYVTDFETIPPTPRHPRRRAHRRSHSLSPTSPTRPAPSRRRLSDTSCCHETEPISRGYVAFLVDRTTFWQGGGSRSTKYTHVEKRAPGRLLFSSWIQSYRSRPKLTLAQSTSKGNGQLPDPRLRIAKCDLQKARSAMPRRDRRPKFLTRRGAGTGSTAEF